MSGSCRTCIPVALTDPAFYAGLAAAITGFLFFTTALQRGSVTLATAMLVVGETGMPALLGVTLFHDHTRPGSCRWRWWGSSARSAERCAVAVRGGRGAARTRADGQDADAASAESSATN